MSVWWLLLVVPGCCLWGAVVMAFVSVRSYDRGYFEGWKAGRERP